VAWAKASRPVPSFSLRPWPTPDPQALLVNIILGLPVRHRRYGTIDIIFPKLRALARLCVLIEPPRPQSPSSQKGSCFKTSPISVSIGLKYSCPPAAFSEGFCILSMYKNMLLHLHNPINVIVPSKSRDTSDYSILIARITSGKLVAAA
jgi:hypothetical protein